MRKAWLLFAALVVATTAQAQLPGLRKRGPVPPAVPVPVGIDALRADFTARAGTNTVYFGGDSAILSPPAKATLGAQAQWLLQHPEVVVRVEGHAEPSDTRDHAVAVGARRAQEVRDYLVLLGVPAAQLSMTTWGKERPGPGRAVTVLVR
jgi:peptidoglycan-associated lipoprotein